MLQEEAFRLRKESTYHDANLQWREMKFWLDQLTSYSQQASIVLGFAFASFCADNLGDLPWETRPLLCGLFVFASALAMTSAISVVAFSSHLMLAAERLAMTTAVKVAAAAVRSRLRFVIILFVTSLVSLFVAAICLVFCMCSHHIIRASDEDEEADYAERHTQEHNVHAIHYIYLSICLYIYIYIGLTRLSICLSIYLSVYLYVHLCSYICIHRYRYRYRYRYRHIHTFQYMYMYIYVYICICI